MKKLIFIAGLALAGVINMSAQSLPTVEVTTVTNTVVTTTVQPITLTADQMAGVIALVQNSGIQANVPITTNNLNRVVVRSNSDGTYTIGITLK